MLITQQGQSVSFHEFSVGYFVYFSGFGYFPDWEIPQPKGLPKQIEQ